MMRIFTLLVLLLVSIGFPATSDAQCPGRDSVLRLRFVMGFDVSRSIGSAQLQVWRSQAEYVVRCLQPGDAVKVLEINASTRQTVARWDQELPAYPPGADLRAVLVVRRQIAAVKKDLLAAVSSVLSESRALDTDLFGVFGRAVDADSRRQTMLVVWSDLLNTVGDPNLEKTRLRETDFKALLASLAKQHMWTPRTLAGARVAFVLPSVDGVRARQPLNDMSMLERFHRLVVESLGGRVEQFGVDLKLPTIARHDTKRR